jgi:23S rRNA pseudouridine1911/1915/1917 synthase
LERFTVTEDAGVRLDRWLADALQGRARHRIQLDLEAGRVLVNGAPQPARYKVREGDAIEYDIPDEVSTRLQPEAIPLSIVFEDEHLLVLDKPAGMVVHPAPGHAGGTVANALLAHCGPSLEGAGGEDRWGIVHRLDNLTSGLMMAAKTPQAYEKLVVALAERRIRRRYLGIALGMFRLNAGTIDQPIGRRRNQRKRMGIVADGRPSRTDWTLLCQDHQLALLGLRLHTGRTHQIRVHLQSIGRPILGDEEYGWTKARTLQALPQRLRPAIAGVWPGRQMLHAAHLAFEHPIIPDCRIDLSSPPPADMRAVLETVWPDLWPERLEQWLAASDPIADEPETGADIDADADAESDPDAML